MSEKTESAKVAAPVGTRRRDQDTEVPEVCAPVGTRCATQGEEQNVQSDMPIPAMPLVPHDQGGTSSHEHCPRDKWPLYNACVACVFARAEIAKRTDAREALQLEGDTLASKEVWLLSGVGVGERSDVAKACR